jgi:hypothetical protein
MFLPALLSAVLLLLAPVPPAPPPVAPADDSPPAAPSPAPDSALVQLSAEARAKAARRAKFVYRLPDGAVWDSSLYCEFRDVLREFDALPKDAQPGPRVRAWGFKAGSRQIGKAEKRPDPLWHTLSPRPRPYTPFIYINTAHTTAADKGHKPMITIEKEVAPRYFQIEVREYPAASLGDLPPSFSYYGLARCTAYIPAEIRARPGDALLGEFFLTTDPDLPRPERAQEGIPLYRLTHAARFRLNPEQYAQALLAAEVELIEWSFRRTTDRLGEHFEWTRHVVEPTPSAGTNDQSAPPPADQPSPPQ